MKLIERLHNNEERAIQILQEALDTFEETYSKDNPKWEEM
jgi:hypothetical protein